MPTTEVRKQLPTDPSTEKAEPVSDVTQPILVATITKVPVGASRAPDTELPHQSISQPPPNKIEEPVSSASEAVPPAAAVVAHTGAHFESGERKILLPKVNQLNNLHK